MNYNCKIAFMNLVIRAISTRYDLNIKCIYNNLVILIAHSTNDFGKPN